MLGIYPQRLFFCCSSLLFIYIVHKMFQNNRVKQASLVLSIDDIHIYIYTFILGCWEFIPKGCSFVVADTNEGRIFRNAILMLALQIYDAQFSRRALVSLRKILSGNNLILSVKFKNLSVKFENISV